MYTFWYAHVHISLGYISSSRISGSHIRPALRDSAKHFSQVQVPSTLPQQAMSFPVRAHALNILLPSLLTEGVFELGLFGTTGPNSGPMSESLNSWAASPDILIT